MTDTLWGSLIKSGYQEVYALEIDGIPRAFGAREMWTVAGGLVPHGSLTTSYGLVIREGMRISVEPDREKGLAAGAAVDFTIGRQQIVDEGLGPILFARPTLRANITSEIDDPATTAFDVDTTSGWPASGGFFIGHEYCTYTGLTATSFTGLTRGVAGLAHYHTANAWGAYRQCTDTPVFWRGRLVTLWAHLVSPEGRYLGDEWCEPGSAYCRQEWRGVVRDPPRPSHEGMTLTCLPLVRVPGMEIGAEAAGRVLSGWIVSEPQDTITVFTPSAILAEVPTEPITTLSGIMTVITWANIVSNHLTTAGVPNSLEVQADRIILEIPGSTDVRVSANAWFIEFDTTPAVGSRFILNFEWADGYINKGWLVCELDMVEDASDVLVGDAGMLAIDIGDHTEIVAYDGVKRIANTATIAFRIVQRGLFGTNYVEESAGQTYYYNPWKDEAKIRVVAGARGTWGECLRTLLTSSGMEGERGAYDTLPFGFGAGLPDEWIADSVGDGYDTVTGGIVISAVTTQRSSIEDLLCGWLALGRKCLVQRRQTDGTIRLEVVSLSPVYTDDELTDADVMLSGHETPETIEGPNHVRIVSSDALNERPLYIVRDAARAQAEGVRSLEVKAPGITSAAALTLGYDMILQSDGQAAAKMQIAPWVDLQSGDQRLTTTAHPVVWDWSTGAFAPESVSGVVTSWSKDLGTGEQEITMLFAGQTQERLLLCPSATVEAAAHPNYSLDDATGFAVGDEIAFYEVSNEDADYAVVTITAIFSDVITVDANPGVTGTEIEVTFADYATATVRERRHMYVRSDKEWRG